ncbi:MAG: Transcriptional regulatory protein ZraR [Acidobacteria bacterium]|nr:Transcriptional regulatory protein ZraR [Acidobacteriota bacterium]
MFGTHVHDGKQILVVEDHPESVDLLQMILENAGYRVRSAETGRQALRAVAAASADRNSDFHPDLILLDLRLPDMNGVDVVRELQKSHSEIPPVIFLSADPPQSLEEAARSVGARAVRKPFDFDELFQAVEGALNKAMA